jgi:hypothetical protein
MIVLAVLSFLVVWGIAFQTATYPGRFALVGLTSIAVLACLRRVGRVQCGRVMARRALRGTCDGTSSSVVATLSYYGWLCSWNTMTVPNGSYS